MEVVSWFYYVLFGWFLGGVGWRLLGHTLDHHHHGAPGSPGLQQPAQLQVGGHPEAALCCAGARCDQLGHGVHRDPEGLDEEDQLLRVQVSQRGVHQHRDTVEDNNNDDNTEEGKNQTSKQCLTMLCYVILQEKPLPKLPVSDFCRQFVGEKASGTFYKNKEKEVVDTIF